ncbi:MAG: adenylyl-sulfate kinase, partial [Candidatus Peregrinibacteria bacterium]|nr:adenylyl-sulfate kinase [Candidatus Peregrinibacteria bacterium]
EQGITIDVAYRFFSSDERSFIIADTPGHTQYTRNMVTAASNADLALILMDARNGVLEQSKRHAFIASLLGIRHMIVAINKMDLVDYNEETYEKIVDEFLRFAERLQVTDIQFVPLSALHGENVVHKSENMPWYNGGTLLHLLNTVHIASDRNQIDFRFPVQYVNRPNSEYRGYCGTIASGAVRPGDDVVVFPGHRMSKIKSIDTLEGSVERAFAPMSVSLTLEDNIDIGRGDMIMPVNNVCEQRTAFDAMVVWLNEEPLAYGKQYLLKHTTKLTTATVKHVRYVMDINTVSRGESRPLAMNEIGRAAIETDEPIAADSYERNRATGSFILIDNATNQTVAAGMIVDRKADESAQDSAATAERFPIFWLTGNTGAGKSTLATAAEKHFNGSTPVWSSAARRVVVLDGDEMRETVSTEEDLSPEGRRRHNLRVARLAALLQQKGFLVVVSVIAPFEEVRKELSAICDPLWVHVKREGLASDEKPYEEPKTPDCVIDHDVADPEEAARSLIDFILSQL